MNFNPSWNHTISILKDSFSFVLIILHCSSYSEFLFLTRYILIRFGTILLSVPILLGLFFLYRSQIRKLVILMFFTLEFYKYVKRTLFMYIFIDIFYSYWKFCSFSAFLPFFSFFLFSFFFSAQLFLIKLLK